MTWLPYGAACNALILLVLFLHTFVLATMPTGAKFYTIHWNSSNPIFRIDNTDNVIDVNVNNLRFEYDQVNLICPVYTPGTRDDDMEKYIIYNVSKDEYETCRITNPNPRIIAVCDKPYKLMYFTIKFRPFTPQPDGGLEFLPGHDYYFISTSKSDDLHRRIGGRCTTHNMKIVFKVWASPADATISTTTSATTSFSRPMWSPILHTRTTTTTTTSTEAPTTKPTKMPEACNKHPNEVVKSEELTLGSSGASKAEAVSSVIITTIYRYSLQVDEMVPGRFIPGRFIPGDSPSGRFIQRIFHPLDPSIIQNI